MNSPPENLQFRNNTYSSVSVTKTVELKQQESPEKLLNGFEQHQNSHVTPLATAKVNNSQSPENILMESTDDYGMMC